MICRVAACLIGSGMVLFGACDQPTEVADTARLAASTTVQAVAPVMTTAAPYRASTTPLVATTNTTTTTATTTTVAATTTSTSTTIPAVTAHLYRMYDRSPEIVQLQILLGLKYVDGIYGPVTRKAHIEYLGGPLTALAVFHPEIDYPVPTSDTTLGELINRYFRPDDRAWARQVAFCESSAQTYDTESAVVSSALAVGWFQHLAKFWSERSEKAGVSGASPFDTEANVAVAAWLLYEGGGTRHWNPSRTCWEKQ